MANTKPRKRLPIWEHFVVGECSRYAGSVSNPFRTVYAIQRCTTLQT